MTKDERKTVINKLKEYSNMDLMIRGIDLEINRIKNDVSLGGGDMFAEKSSPTNKFNSSVENDVIHREAIDIDGIIEKLENKKRYLISRKEYIKDVLNSLSDLQRNIIDLYYLCKNKVTWVYVSMQLGYDEYYCRKVGSKTLEQLSILI